MSVQQYIHFERSGGIEYLNLIDVLRYTRLRTKTISKFEAIIIHQAINGYRRIPISIRLKILSARADMQKENWDSPVIQYSESRDIIINH